MYTHIVEDVYFVKFFPPNVVSANEFSLYVFNSVEGPGLFHTHFVLANNSACVLSMFMKGGKMERGEERVMKG